MSSELPKVLEFSLLAFSSLFVIVDPIAVIPGFLAITPSDSPAQRERMARLASFVMAGVLLAFALLGKWIFQFLGITLPAFQIAGSVILLLVALDMLKAQRSRVQETREETEAGAQKLDIAITPLNRNRCSITQLSSITFHDLRINAVYLRPSYHVRHSSRLFNGLPACSTVLMRNRRCSPGV